MRNYIATLFFGLSIVAGDAFVSSGMAASSDVALSPPSPEILRDVEGVSALAWVKAQNEATFARLESDPRYANFYNDVLKVEQEPSRLAAPQQQGGLIWNFWQDRDHARGIWRVTAPQDFRSKNPSWTIKLDIDRLASTEHQNWVFQGANCLEPEGERCLLRLSIAGEDAMRLREFDTRTGAFVDGGFDLPRSKQQAAWMDRGHVLVARDWGEGTRTRSGYPFVVKLVTRGASLREAKEIMRGAADDMMVAPKALHDNLGNRLFLIERHLDFFRSRYSVLDPSTFRVRDLKLPERIGYLGFCDNRLIVRLDDNWKADGYAFREGSVLALDPVDPMRAPSVLFEPTSSQTTTDIEVTSRGVLAVVYENVQPSLRLFYLNSVGASWKSKTIALPGNVSAKIVSASSSQDDAYVQVESYIQPPQLWIVETKQRMAHKFREGGVQFPARDLVVEQMWTSSSDVAKIPYFIVHRRSWHLNGRNPVLFTAYGGFDLSYLPTYYPDVGVTWLQHGGVYVVGNIRGGGEFGPAWHRAGMKSGRQHAYDDFAAIAHDLFRRGITDTSHLGIRGRSNGGLLMGVEMTQHPDLWKAVVIGVPLLDMMNFETMAAGASWNAEYGSVSVPEEKDFLARISPLHHLKEDVRYPVPFIFTSTKDDRVGPVHARLFAARLQQLGKPFYYYEDTEGGHAGTVNAREIAHERALEAVYLTRSLMDK